MIYSCDDAQSTRQHTRNSPPHRDCCRACCCWSDMSTVAVFVALTGSTAFVVRGLSISGGRRRVIQSHFVAPRRTLRPDTFQRYLSSALGLDYVDLEQVAASLLRWLSAETPDYALSPRSPSLAMLLRPRVCVLSTRRRVLASPQATSVEVVGCPSAILFGKSSGDLELRTHSTQMGVVFPAQRLSHVRVPRCSDARFSPAGMCCPVVALATATIWYAVPCQPAPGK